MGDGKKLKEFIDSLWEMLLQMESDSDIQVEVFAADLQKGVLNVKIVERYHNILGKKEEITWFLHLV